MYGGTEGCLWFSYTSTYGRLPDGGKRERVFPAVLSDSKSCQIVLELVREANLKDCQHGHRERVEVGGRSSELEVESASKELHAEEGEDEDEEEEEEEEGHDGLHGGEQGDHQVPQGRPIPGANFVKIL